jgi:hypothetical protein
MKFKLVLFLNGGTRCCSCLRHCATSRKVAGSIPDDITGIFHWHNPSSRIMALGLTQPLTKNIPGIFPGVKAAGASGWQLYHLHVPIVLKSASLNLLEPSGTVQACNGIAFPLFLNMPYTEHTQLYHRKINIVCVVCTSRMKHSHRISALAQVSSPKLLHSATLGAGRL